MNDREILRSFGYDPDDPVPRDEEGQRIIPDKLLRNLARTPFIAEAAYTLKAGGLSAANVEVLRGASRGLTVKEIAAETRWTYEGVRELLAAARNKLGARNRTHACCEAIRRGLIP